LGHICDADAQKKGKDGKIINPLKIMVEKLKKQVEKEKQRMRLRMKST